jgi:hypothetical protein
MDAAAVDDLPFSERLRPWIAGSLGKPRSSELGKTLCQLFGYVRRAENSLQTKVKSTDDSESAEPLALKAPTIPYFRGG